MWRQNAQYTVLTRETVISLNEVEWTTLASRNQSPSPDVVGILWSSDNTAVRQTKPLYVWWGSAATETQQKQKGTGKPRHETWGRSNQIPPASLEVQRGLLLAQALAGWWWSPADYALMRPTCAPPIATEETLWTVKCVAGRSQPDGSAAFKFQGSFLKTYFPPPFSRHFCPQLLCYRKYQNDLEQSRKHARSVGGDVT